MNKFITIYSDTHMEMYEKYFLNSYKEFLSNNFNFFPKKVKQKSKNGEICSNGFDITMLEKINWIISNIDLNDSNYLVYSDCDVQFFKGLEFDFFEKDILFQKDFYDNSYCAGFFICKQNQKVLNFFEKVYETFIHHMNGTIHDQDIINGLFQSGYSDLNKGFLPKEKYWTVGNSTNAQAWTGQDISVPKEIIMHHANFCIGVENKLKLLELVKEKVNK